MKYLLLVRHAKSDWGNPALDDFDRPLNERGKRDAPAMAKRIHERIKKIDAFISSPARRARKTAFAFASEYGLDKDDVILKEELYLAGEEEFFATVQGAKDKHEVIAVFSHNPGITHFANLLTNARIDNIPTTGVFAVKANCEHWADFMLSKKEFLFFDYPKAV